jgi:rhamnose utilization protein RhaD (predicted bifunctional aldolase and dehydrogenase)
MDDLGKLVALSRRYGSDPEWVLAGGGNTSFKDSSTLYVKASGTSLASISESGFCSIDRKRLDAMWKASYPEETEEREASALADLMAARSVGESKRPSVETLMHGLFPQAYVVHTHPAAINGITCGREGRDAFERLFGEEGVWVPFVDPGYILAKTVRSALEAFRSRKGRVPGLMFMQNHGLLVAGESPEEVASLSDRVMAAVLGRIARKPDLSARSADVPSIAAAAGVLSRLTGAGMAIRIRVDAETLARAESTEAFSPLSSSFTPDHIVYAGHEFLRVEGPGAIEAGWADFEARNSSVPRLIVVKGLGAFSCAAGSRAAETAMLLYSDACKVAAYAESFGGALHMTKEKIDFIRNWEVEKYRSAVNTGK